MIAVVNLVIADYCDHRISKMALLCFHPFFTSCEIVKNNYFFTFVPYILLLRKVFYYQLMQNRIDLKRSIKIYIKTNATCFGVTTIIRERTV